MRTVLIRSDQRPEKRLGPRCAQREDLGNAQVGERRPCRSPGRRLREKPALPVLDRRRPASRATKRSIPVVQAPQAVALCVGSPRRPVQWVTSWGEETEHTGQKGSGRQVYAVSLSAEVRIMAAQMPPVSKGVQREKMRMKPLVFHWTWGYRDKPMVIRTQVRRQTTVRERHGDTGQKRWSDQELTSGGKVMDPETAMAGRQGDTYTDTSTHTQTAGQARAPGNPTGLRRWMSGSEPRRLRCGDGSLPNREPLVGGIGSDKHTGEVRRENGITPVLQAESYMPPNTTRETPSGRQRATHCARLPQTRAAATTTYTGAGYKGRQFRSLEQWL